MKVNRHTLQRPLVRRILRAALPESAIRFGQAFLTSRRLKVLLARPFPSLKNRYACYGDSVPAADVARETLLERERKETIALPAAEREEYLVYAPPDYPPLEPTGLPLHYRATVHALAECEVLPRAGAILHRPSGRIVTPTGRSPYPHEIKPCVYRGTLEIPGTTIGLLKRYNAQFHYFHFILDFLKPLFLMLREVPDARTATILLHPDPSPIQASLVQTLCNAYPGLRLLSPPVHQRIRCERILYVASPNIDMVHWIGDRETMHALRTLFHSAAGVAETEGHGDRLLYLSRRNINRRAILNEDQVISALAREGLELVRPEELSLVEQVRLFASARVIVGGVGAALTNALFCRPDSAMVALAPTSIHYPLWGIFGRQMGMDYRSVLTSEGGANHSSYNVPVDQVVRAVHSILAADLTTTR